VTEAGGDPAILAGRYRLGATLAVGGSAILTHALDLTLDRPVVLKRARDAGDAAVAARLRREAAILARCAHPGVVACHALIEDDAGAPCLVLQALDGTNLVQRDAAGAIPLEVALGWAVEVCRAAAHLEARGIVHGDLKPSHVVVDRDGRAVLVDFDRAHDGTPDDARGGTGTEPYVAPEVRGGAPTSAASDRYALGALLRWLLGRAGAAPALAAAVAPLLAGEPASRPSPSAVAEVLARSLCSAG